MSKNLDSGFCRNMYKRIYIYIYIYSLTSILKYIHVRVCVCIALNFVKLFHPLSDLTWGINIFVSLRLSKFFIYNYTHPQYVTRKKMHAHAEREREKERERERERGGGWRGWKRLGEGERVEINGKYSSLFLSRRHRVSHVPCAGPAFKNSSNRIACFPTEKQSDIHWKDIWGDTDQYRLDSRLEFQFANLASRCVPQWIKLWAVGRNSSVDGALSRRPSGFDFNPHRHHPT